MEYTVDEKRVREAYDALLKYLSVSARSEQECKDKLYEKGFHRGEVDGAIEKAKYYHFIDDEQYVRNYIACGKNRYGAKKLAYKLTNEKGVNQAIVANAIADLLEEEEQLEICRQFAKKYIKKKRIEDKKDAQKVSAFLYQKGFEWGVINKVVDKLFDVYFDEN